VAVASAKPYASLHLAPRQITMPAPHYSVFFTGRMPFLSPNQQRQSTECNYIPQKPLYAWDSALEALLSTTDTDKNILFQQKVYKYKTQINEYIQSHDCNKSKQHYASNLLLHPWQGPREFVQPQSWLLQNNVKHTIQPITAKNTHTHLMALCPYLPG